MKITVNNLNFIVSDQPVSEQDETMLTFWKQCGKNWESHTYAIFDKFLDKDHTYLDIGAWIGPTVLYGAQIAKTSYCFEPDKLAFLYLINNIKVNPELLPNIKSFEFGISDKNKTERFYVGNGSTSMSSVKPNHVNVDSSYEILLCDMETAVTKAEIDFKQVNFIKIDIEGGEYDLIPSLLEYCKQMNHFPVLYISLHAPFLFNPIWKNNIFFKLLAYLPKQITARFENKRITDLLSNSYKYIYLPDGTLLTSLSRLGDARAFQEIVVTNKPW